MQPVPQLAVEEEHQPKNQPGEGDLLPVQPKNQESQGEAQEQAEIADHRASPHPAKVAAGTGMAAGGQMGQGVAPPASQQVAGEIQGRHPEAGFPGKIPTLRTQTAPQPDPQYSRPQQQNHQRKVDH